jgi:hypothetical protein
MAHFARLNDSNMVVEVIVINNAELIGPDGLESELKGIDFCKSLFGSDTTWVQTSYNGRIRKNYAGVGFTYDAALDAFIPPQPFPSWTLNQNTCLWNAPVPMPSDGKLYLWDEGSLSWVESPGP